MKRKLTDAEKELVRKEYPKGDLGKLSAQLGITVKSLYRRAHNMEVKRDPEMVLQNNQQLGKNMAHLNMGRLFQKGMPAHNKGKKQAEYMSPEKIAQTLATRFKKGQNPHNTRPIGYERINVDGYIEVKVRHDKNDSTSNFVQKHHLIYEKHFGALPDGYAVWFVDGDKQNFAIENLQSVSRAELLKKNSYCDASILKRFMQIKDPVQIEEYVTQYPHLIELKRMCVIIKGKINERNKKS